MFARLWQRFIPEGNGNGDVEAILAVEPVADAAAEPAPPIVPVAPPGGRGRRKGWKHGDHSKLKMQLAQAKSSKTKTRLREQNLLSALRPDRQSHIARTAFGG